MQITPDAHGIPWVRNPHPDPPSEHWEQCVAVQRLRALGWVVAAIPNGGKRSTREADALKAEGVLAGFPDLVCIQGGRVVFIEMKRRKGAKLHGGQPHVLRALMRAGAEVYVCEGWEAALWICEPGNARP